jgi:hypothetical protein
LKVSNRKKLINRTYHLHGYALGEVSTAKYLRVNINNTHISQITEKANKTLGFLRRNLKVSSIKIKTQAFLGLVRLQLEYASSVWDPHIQCNINKLELTQVWRTAWYVIIRHNTSSVSSMLEDRKWSTLQDRRKIT